MGKLSKDKKDKKGQSVKKEERGRKEKLKSKGEINVKWTKIKTKR
jgi:hypothetical protein